MILFQKSNTLKLFQETKRMIQLLYTKAFSDTSVLHKNEVS